MLADNLLHCVKIWLKITIQNICILETHAKEFSFVAPFFLSPVYVFSRNKSIAEGSRGPDDQYFTNTLFWEKGREGKEGRAPHTNITAS